MEHETDNFTGDGRTTKTKPRITLSVAAGTVAFLLLGAWVWVVHWQPRRAASQLTACKSNLKNIGTALEMYSTDWAGKYPLRLEHVVPNYLKTIPECPAAGTATYKASFGVSAPNNTQGYEDYYYIECEGGHHAQLTPPGNYPAYSGLQSVLERFPE